MVRYLIHYLFSRGPITIHGNRLMECARPLEAREDVEGIKKILLDDFNSDHPGIEAKPHELIICNLMRLV